MYETDTPYVQSTKENAKKGDIYEQSQLGHWYQTGSYVEKDFEKAVYWLEKAANKGEESAQHNLGNCYYYGEGVDQNYSIAIEWFEKAAKKDVVNSQYMLAYTLYTYFKSDENDKKAFYWFEKAAKNHDSESQFCLGEFYQHGIGVEQNMKEAIYWYEKSADCNYIHAQLKLGDLYQYGVDGYLEINLNKALEYYFEAAYQFGENNPEAMFRIASIYYYGGKNLIKDHGLAAYWYKQAYKLGIDEAYIKLEEIKSKMQDSISKSLLKKIFFKDTKVTHIFQPIYDLLEKQKQIALEQDKQFYNRDLARHGKYLMENIKTIEKILNDYIPNTSTNSSFLDLKNIKFIIEKEQNTELDFTFVGPCELGKYYDDIIELIKQLQIENTVY